MSDRLTLERDEGGVYTLTIRRPDVRNALDEQAFHELIAACEQVGDDHGARVLVLTGEGRAFSAGGDFDSLQRMLDGDRAYAVAELENAGAGISALARIPVPTVAALNGDAFGGGAAVGLFLTAHSTDSVAIRAVGLAILPACFEVARRIWPRGGLVALFAVFVGGMTAYGAALAHLTASGRPAAQAFAFGFLGLVFAMLVRYAESYELLAPWLPRKSGS